MFLDQTGEVHGVPLLHEYVVPAEDDGARLGDLEADDVTPDWRGADLTLVLPAVRLLSEHFYQIFCLSLSETNISTSTFQSNLTKGFTLKGFPRVVFVSQNIFLTNLDRFYLEDVVLREDLVDGPESLV